MRTLYDNGQVYTGKLPLAEAFVVENGRFLAVGNREEVLNYVDNATEKVELGGKFVCAGFNDSHMHLLNYGYTLSMADLSGHTSSLREMLEYLRNFDEERHEHPGSGEKAERQNHPEYQGNQKNHKNQENHEIQGNEESQKNQKNQENQNLQWLLGRGWNQDYFADERRFPTRKDLDTVSKTRPVCVIRACGHCCAVNSRALELMGITADTPQPEGRYFELGPDGAPNGVFRENAVEYVYRCIPAPSLEQLKEMMRRAIRKLNAYGVTSVQTDDFLTLPVPYRQVIRAFQQLEQEGGLTVRVYEQAQFPSVEDLREFLDDGWKPGGGSQWFRIGPLKIVADGSLGSRTAYLSRPYEDEPSAQGMMLYSREQLEQMLAKAASQGMQTAVHAIGDGTLDVLLDLYEQLAQGQTKRRDGIVHCQITRPRQLERMARLGLCAYVQPIFLDYDQRIVEQRVGRELASSSYAFHTMKEKGIHVAAGSDCPVEAPDVLAGIQCAVTRKTLDGSWGPYCPGEAMSVQEALDAYTIEGAYASFEETVKGKIQAGMLADFVVLGENPFEVPASRLHRIPVLDVYVGGRRVGGKA